jgi:hypothetical protein
MNSLPGFTKSTLILGLVLTVYGYLCRALDLFFFWESKSIGWAIIAIGIISLLFNRVKIRKIERKKSLLTKIGIGILIIFLLVQAILLIVIPNTDAYKIAKEYLITNTSLKGEIGEIKRFSLIPLGAMEMHSGGGIEYGSATILFTVKGEEKFKDITVYLEKRPDTKWLVLDTE